MKQTRDRQTERRGDGEESNEAMYVLSLVALMVSAGHNSLLHTRTQTQMSAHLYVCVHLHAQTP